MGTGTAPRTFIVVDLCKIIRDSYCLFGTYLFTFFTANTSVFTSLTRVRSLIAVITHDHSHSFLRNHGNDLFGAGAYAKTAAEASACIHVSDTVLGAYSTRGADCGAVAVAETAIHTGIGTAVEH